MIIVYEDLYVYNTSGVDLPSMIVLSGISYCDGSYLIERPRSRFGTVEYVISGTGTIFCDGKQYTASAGDAYFLPVGKNQRYFSDPDNPWVKIFFNMTGNLCNLLADEYSFSGGGVFKNCNIEDSMREMFSYKFENLPPFELQQKSLLLAQSIFMQIYSVIRQNKPLSPELKTMKDYIDIHITDSLSLDDLANTVYRSKNYVIKLFKEGFGQTPYEYFLDRKMTLSKKLLDNTNMPIQQVSEYLGFENANYFSNCFRNKFGTSPLAYRRRQIGESDNQTR